MQSGAFDNYTVQTNADANFRSLARLSGCADADADDGARALECLRAMPLSRLRGALGNTSDGGSADLFFLATFFGACRRRNAVG